MFQKRNDSSIYETSRTADRILNIFEFLEQCDVPQSITEIAAQIELPKATAFRLVTTLRERGYLAQDRPRGGYRLGARLVRIGVRARRQMGVVETAAPILKRLALETGESCQVSVREGDYALCVVRESAPDQREWSITGDVGTIFPLHASAVGKVLLAFLPTAERAAYLAKPLVTNTPHTLIDTTTLEKLAQKIRDEGIAQDEEEFRIGLAAVAAPVYGAEGDVVAAIGVILLRQSKAEGEKALARVIPFLQKAAHELSVGLGAVRIGTEGK